MAQKTDIINLVRSFCREVDKNNKIKIRKAYLFGSMARGKSNKYSDIDIAIVSDSFSGFKYHDRAMLNPYILRINTSLEIHPFTKNEFNSNTPFVKEIKKTGIRIY